MLSGGGAGFAQTRKREKMGAEKCALYKLIASMSIADLSQFNFALMLFNESPDSSGYPRKAFFHVTTARR